MKSKPDNYKGSGMSKGAYQKYESTRKKTFGLGAKQPKQKVAQKPVYKSGMLPSGQPRNYGTSKRGTITSID